MSVVIRKIIVDDVLFMAKCCLVIKDVGSLNLFIVWVGSRCFLGVGELLGLMLFVLLVSL